MIKMQAVLYARMLAMMRDDPCSIADLAEETGLHVTTVREYTKQLHKLRLISIHDWVIRPLSKHRTPVFVLGDKKDAKRPPPITASVRQMNCRRRKRQRELQAAMNQLVRGAA